MYLQAWPGHKPACKPSDDPVPVTDIEKSGLFWIGITKIPSDVTESQTAIDKLQGEQRELLKVRSDLPLSELTRLMVAFRRSWVTPVREI
jgi:hypothetical protein